MQQIIYKTLILATSVASLCFPACAQQETAAKGFFKPLISDTGVNMLNMDAIYNRPFLQAGNWPVSVGGYLEMNTQYAVTDGVNEGNSFQFRRVNLFLSSKIAQKINFVSELNFENGNQFAVQSAVLDFEFHRLLNLRGGILLNPIGGFNQNHDGPKWDFVDMPISSTTILPAVLSEAGFELFGKYRERNWVIGYEACLTNGFDDKIILNTLNRTSLAEGSGDPAKFQNSNSGIPMFTGKIDIRNKKIGEIGISYMSGVYNKWKDEGLVIDKKRSVNVMALDFNTSVFKNCLNIYGEAAKVFVDVPDTYSQQFGNEQWGGFLDIVGTILQARVLNWDKAKLNIGVRLEYADYNIGKFSQTGANIYDDTWSLYPVIAFRPTSKTVIRLNYRYQEQRDIVGNPAIATGVIQFGIASYF